MMTFLEGFTFFQKEKAVVKSISGRINAICESCSPA